jgi:hypothetical protein
MTLYYTKEAYTTLHNVMQHYIENYIGYTLYRKLYRLILIPPRDEPIRKIADY